jgi:hypothetical protein
MVDRTAEHSTSRLSRSHDEGAYLNPLMALTHEDLGMLPNASTRTPRLSKILVLRLCLVGFLCNCQPSEPFLARYLLEDKVRSPNCIGFVPFLSSIEISSRDF